MYTSPKRVERNGYLVCFAGEQMTDEEARKRGLLDIDAPEEEKPEKKSGKTSSKKTSGKKPSKE